VSAEAGKPRPWQVEVRSGRMMDLSALAVGANRFMEEFDSIKLADIAHSLSNLCRFNGHCRRFYSVAQHSVLVARVVRFLDGGMVAQRWALLHDAHEAYVGDVIRPIKAPMAGAVPMLDLITRGLDAAIAFRYVHGQRVPDPEAAVDARELGLVADADRIVLLAEKRYLLGPALWRSFTPDQIEEAASVVGPIRPLGPRAARRLFYREARRLGIARNARWIRG